MISHNWEDKHSLVTEQPNAAFIEESRKLFSQAVQAMADNDFEKALSLCAQMTERGFSGGWELKSQIQAKRGEKATALLTLRELLGLHLTNCSSKDQEIEAHAHHVRLIVRAGLTEAVDHMAEQDWVLDAYDVLSYAADESLQLGLKGQARKFALSATAANRTDESALWYIREAIGLQSPKTVMRQFMVSGHNRNSGQATSVEYHVASDTLEQAKDFIREMEPDMPVFQIGEILQEEPREELPWGVYWRSP